MPLPPGKYPRYLPSEGATAALRPIGERIGLVHDIGIDGLSFDYLVLDMEVPRHGGASNGRIDVFFPEKETLLLGLPCRVVREYGLPSYRDYATGSIFFKRVDVQFREITPGDRKQLEDLLSGCQPISHLQQKGCLTEGNKENEE